MLKFRLKKRIELSKLISCFVLSCYAMCNSGDSETQERFINEFIHDDTTALILVDYQKWFRKYAAPNVSLSPDQCEEIGCYYSEGVYLVDSIKRETITTSVCDVDWGNYICDTLLLKKNHNLRSKEKIRKENVIFFSHRYVIGKVLYTEKRIDTSSVLFLNGRASPIIRHPNNYITMSTAIKMSLL